MSNPDSLNIKMIQAFCISKTRGKKDFITALENIKNLHQTQNKDRKV